MNDPRDLDDLIDRLGRAAAPSAADVPALEVTDRWERVHLSWDEAGVRARVDRALCPDPADRKLLEDAVAEVARSLVEQREQEQRALGEALGRELSSQVEADLAEPTAQLEERVRQLRERMQSSRDRAARRRQR